MGGLLDFSRQTQQTTNVANYDLADTSANAGDNSVVASGGSTVSLSTVNNTLDGGAIQSAADLAAMALGTAVNAQTLAAQSLGVVVNGQTLQAELGNQTARVLTAAADNNLAALQALTRSQNQGLSEALATSDAATRRATAAAEAAAAEAAAASRAASSAALGAADAAIASGDRARRDALGFGSDALQSIAAAQRASFGFAGDALSASISSGLRGVATAENALDASLSFARSTGGAANTLVSDALSSVIRLVSDTAKSTQAEAQATRDFAGEFVGDFYESQKSGDVQTIQNIAKYAGAVGIALALAWALRGARSAS